MPPAETGPPAESGAEAARLPAGFAVGEYRIEALLGEGGMGAVYGAIQPEIGARVAIKVLGRELSRDPRLVKRFVDEARAVNKIRHPNIIDIFAFGRLADGRQYFVMEFLDGETLAARIARGPLPVTEARRLLLQACEALEAAHAEKIVHRDLKPENLWIAAPRHGQPYLKVLDFGIAKLIGEHEAGAATELGVAMGTPHYMSPEQCRGEVVDHRTDIYAMGVLLYLMWGGRLPFDGGSYLAVVSQQVTATPAPPSTHRPVAPALERLILRCLDKDPARRPESAHALGKELEAALADLLPGETLPQLPAPVAAAMASAPAPAPVTAQPRRSGVRLAIAGAAVLAVATAGALLVRGARQSAAPLPNPLPASRGEGTASRTPAAAPLPNPLPASRGEGTASGTPVPSTAVEVPAAAAPAEAAPSPAEPAAKAASAPVRDRRAPAVPPAARPGSRLDERGFIKENPFR